MKKLIETDNPNSSTFVVTMLLLIIIDNIPGLSLRASEESEIIGIDLEETGEVGYDFAYLLRDVESPHE